jgi:hypothetical protein
MSPQDLIQRLQEALQETQRELVEAERQLRAVPWLLGALRYLADDECPYAQPPPETDEPLLECACPVCTAKGALARYEALRPVPDRPGSKPA